MAVTAPPIVGQSQTFEAVADDPAGAPDPNAEYTWSENSAGTLISLVDPKANPVVVDYVGAGGPVTLHLRVDDPDGNFVEATYEIPLILLATDASSITITPGPITDPAPVTPTAPAEPPVVEPAPPAPAPPTD